MKISVCLAGLLFLILTTPAYPRTWYITPDGTGAAPTIRAGIDSAVAGDTVLVLPGIYFESNIRMKAGISLLSEGGSAESVIIDGQSIDGVFICDNCDSSTTIRGFTITNGQSFGVPGGRGGGMLCGWSSGLRIVNCDFIQNVADYGAGLYCQYSSPVLLNCRFIENGGASEGGGIYCEASSPVLEYCILAGNSAGWGGGLCCSVISAPVLLNCTLYGNHGHFVGGGIDCYGYSEPRLENTILAYSTAGGAIVCDDGTGSPVLYCSDVFGNVGGDWTGCIEDQLTRNGNFSACPSFCNVEEGNLALCNQSPCLPGNHPDGYDCPQIGARGAGCDCGPTDSVETTWGNIKSIFR